MKEIYILEKGDSLEKARFELGINKELKVANKKIKGYKYVVVEDGSDEIVLVKNYLPYYIYQVKKQETLLDILAMGFKVDNVNSVNLGDYLVLSRPKSIKYIVKPLENLDDISFKLGVLKQDIMKNNELKSEKLFVGQVLWI